MNSSHAVPEEVGGHAMVFDLSDVLYPTTPEAQRPNTWNANAADWPQYQQNAQRTGYLTGRPRGDFLVPARIGGVCAGWEV